MDKEYILKLSNEAMISLNDTEAEQILKSLVDFDEAMNKLNNIDTSKFLNSEIFNLKFTSIRTRIHEK